MSLATITALVDDKLRSLTLGEAADLDARDRAIAGALVQYGEDEPRDLVADVAGLVGWTIPVPVGWVAGRSRLQAVEYPLGRVPMATLEAAEYHTADGWSILLADEAPGIDVRLHYSVPYADDASTVPAHHVNAIACWAVAELCMQMATQAGHERDASISAGAVQPGSRSGELSRRAREWRAVYRVALGLPDPDKAGTASGGKPAGAVVSWGARRVRGRFHTYGG